MLTEGAEQLFGILVAIEAELEAAHDGGTTAGDEALRGFIWRQGVMTDLGTVDGDSCSDAFVINAKGEVIGPSFDCSVEGLTRGYL